MLGVTEKKSPLDQVVDLFVYAPLGLALTVRDELPTLIERGRTQVEAQTTLARMIGQFVVVQGQKEAEKLARRMTGAANGPAPAPGPRPSTTPSFSGDMPGPGPDSRRKTTGGNGAAPSADHLAIPGYDALAASQVVPRLAGLSADELEAVRRYEAATRNRRTILARIQQLQSAAG